MRPSSPEPAAGQKLAGAVIPQGHPTGYPLYALLLKLFTLLPVGEIAYRTNLSSAVLAALAVALVYRIVLKLTGAVVSSMAAAAARTDSGRCVTAC